MFARGGALTCHGVRERGAECAHERRGSRGLPSCVSGGSSCARLNPKGQMTGSDASVRHYARKVLPRLCDVCVPVHASCACIPQKGFGVVVVRGDVVNSSEVCAERIPWWYAESGQKSGFVQVS